MSLLTDNKLQSKFGTQRINSRIKFLDIITEPVLATFEKEPFAIWWKKLLEHFLYLEKKIDLSLVMWFDAPESTI